MKYRMGLIGLLLGSGFMLASSASAGPVSLLVSGFSSDNAVLYGGANGELVSEFVAAGAGGLDGAWGVTFGPDHNLYVASSGTNSVLRYNGTTGGFIDVLPRQSLLPGPGNEKC